MKKCPIASSLYLYNKSQKTINMSDNKYTSTEHDYKEQAVDKIGKKSFILAYFLSRKNKS